MTMKKMDQDKDGRVSFSDFLETVKQVNNFLRERGDVFFSGAFNDGSFRHLSTHW